MAEVLGKFLANGGHAQQEIPAQHRLLNAGGMFMGWAALDQLRHIMFGLQMKSEGEYVEVKREDVPAPLRFLHKTIDWDPHSEAPEHQWKKLVYQFMPGAGAGVGAVMGSMYAFQRNGREQQYKAANLKGLDKLNMMDADFVAQFAQSTPLRIAAGFFGTFSAASGLTPVYGLFLNNAFAASNGAKIFSGFSKGNLAPHKALDAQLDMVGSYVQQGLKTGKIDETWAHEFSQRVLRPLFGHELNTPELQEQAVKKLQAMFEHSYNRFNAHGRPAKEIADAVTKDLKQKLGAANIEKTLEREFGLHPKNAVLGNANPIIRQFNDMLNFAGISRKVTTTEDAGYGMAGPALMGAGVLAGGAYSMSAAGKKGAGSESSPVDSKHPCPEVEGQSPAQYVAAAMEMHNIYNKQKQPPGLLKWMGDAQLAVAPTNRLDCAIGLTAGLLIAGNLAKIATGHGLDGKAVDMAKTPTYLQKYVGIIKDYNPKGLRPRDRWIKYAQWTAYSMGGMIGIKLGTNHAYRKVKKNNADPHYLEDYLPRVAMHQGETWSWLAAFSGIFGSASGLFTLPVPGINYALGLAGRSTSMQDRNFMIGGLNEILSGATTTSYLRLREGLSYMCHYAVGNPEETPAQLEFLAYAILGPVFKDQLTANHIKQFTQAMHEVRDRYWEPGGIPKEKRKEAYQAIREVFTGAGLEVLLIDLGLNPGTVAFKQLNGLTGKIGNIGISNKIQTEQEAYQRALNGRLENYVKEKLITPEQMEWVKTGLEAMKKGEKPPVAPFSKSADNEVQQSGETAPEQPAQKNFTDRHLPKQSAAQDLLRKAEKQGDWRQKASLPKDVEAPLAIGG